uniref:Uncharacterized protein n=1 Tax=Candidatus Kentrum sp. TC TaxID=2126339 RepID=A0A450Z1A9_9GAMM|nr:MAG: hypothetical protein BECKTC1821E_GA0114239_10869 [Candidatus Kentron sp. TC]
MDDEEGVLIHISEKYIWSAPRCKEEVQRRDKGSSANGYPALTDEATSSLCPRWKSTCSDLIETAALERASGSQGTRVLTLLIPSFDSIHATTWRGNSNGNYD